MYRRVALAVVIVGLASAGAQAWYAQGHGVATRAAVAGMPAEVPDFFRAGAAAIMHGSADPDVYKEVGLNQLRVYEEPEHFLDFELLKGATLPPGRYDYLRYCYTHELDPARVGTVPYAVTEWTQRLTYAFAEHRRWPDNPYIKHKCLLYAGMLAHYAQDLCQPLHTTVHYDGRARADGSSPHSGIHGRVDALFQHLPPTAEATAIPTNVEVFAEVWAETLAEFKRSHALVERVYELEAELPRPSDRGVLTPKVEAFAEERLATSARFTAALYLSAWRDSSAVRLPRWHEREDAEKVPPTVPPVPMPSTPGVPLTP